MTSPSDLIKRGIRNTLVLLYDELRESHFCMGDADDTNVLRMPKEVRNKGGGMNMQKMSWYRIIEQIPGWHTTINSMTTTSRLRRCLHSGSAYAIWRSPSSYNIIFTWTQRCDCSKALRQGVDDDRESSNSLGHGGEKHVEEGEEPGIDLSEGDKLPRSHLRDYTGTSWQGLLMF